MPAKQPKLTAIIQSCQLTLFGHIMRLDDNADAKRILLASPPDWRRQLGRPRITWLSTIQQDLKQHHLKLPEAAVPLQVGLAPARGVELATIQKDVTALRRL